ncbi:putative methyltransferase-domain-containing protein [Amanita rubescens]|nr:putative methyltransferase-domain-containing protein [Amanita rubescens]
MVPTTKLPQIQSIPSQSTKNLADALGYLQSLYQPPVRGSRRRRSTPNREPRVHLDPFERNYTLRWLTALISHLETRDYGDSDDSADSEVESLIQLAASILALCSGTAGAGTFHRDFVFTSTCVPSCSVTVRVKDIPLDNQDYASVGAQTWGGACVLAESIVDEPWKFGLCPAQQESASFRILELGAGTGLVSLTVAKLLQNLSTTSPSPSSAIVIATDYYSPVLHNLASNITTNFPQPSISITSHHLDWSHFSSTYASVGAPPPKPFDEPFDIILGADIIYELDHATWIKSCLSVLLQKPGLKKDPSRTFHLVIPLRSTHVKESSTVELVFPFAEASSTGLCILSKEVIICETEEEDGGEGVNYLYYKIGWHAY